MTLEAALAGYAKKIREEPFYHIDLGNWQHDLNARLLRHFVDSIQPDGTIDWVDSLFIRGCHELGDSDVAYIAKRFGYLKVLVLDGCEAIGIESVHAIASGCPNIQALSIADCPRVNDGCIEQISTALRSIEDLDLSGCTQITDHSAISLAVNCKRLRILRLRRCKNISQAGAERLVRDLPNHATLDLLNTGVKLPSQLSDQMYGTTVADLAAYFSGISEVGSGPARLIRLVLLGNGRVGKTSLRRSLCREPHNPQEEPTLSWEREVIQISHAADERALGSTQSRQKDSTKKTPDVQTDVAVFDFGGQDQLHASHRLFLNSERNVFTIILNAWMSLHENSFGHWLRCIQHFAGDGAPIIVVVTGCDARKRVLSPDSIDIDWVYKEYGIHVSAVVEGFDSSSWDRAAPIQTHPVHSALRKILEGKAGTASRKVSDTVSSEIFPKSTLDLMAYLEDAQWPAPQGESSSLEIYDLPRFATCHPIRGWFDKVARSCQVPEDAIEISLKLLHSIGVLFAPTLHPRVELPSLKERILHPEWLKKQIYSLTGIDGTRRVDSYGFISKDDLDKFVWTDLPPHFREWIIELMSVDGLILEVEEPDAISGKRVSGYFVLDRVASAPSDQRLTASPHVEVLAKWSTDVFLPRHLLLRLVGAGRILVKPRLREHLYVNHITAIHPKDECIEALIGFDPEDREVSIRGSVLGIMTDANQKELEHWVHKITTELEWITCRPAKLDFAHLDDGGQPDENLNAEMRRKASSALSVSKRELIEIDFPVDDLGSVRLLWNGTEQSRLQLLHARTKKPKATYWTMLAFWENYRKSSATLLSNNLAEKGNLIRNRTAVEMHFERGHFGESTARETGGGQKLKSDAQTEFGRLGARTPIEIDIVGDGGSSEYRLRIRFRAGLP